MSIVKSFSFPKGDIRGDTFYIKHGVSSFTVIDCYLLSNSNNEENNRQQEIIDEIVEQSEGRVRRFISTHPDNDHIAGIEELFKRWSTTNFYAVDNEIPKDKSKSSLTKYLELKNNHNFAIKRGIKRCWLNDSNDEHKSSGINFQWPILSNKKFKEALDKVSQGQNVNDICPIFTYSIDGGAKYMWMGDLETEMQQAYYDECSANIPRVNILFQPHHGRKSASVPENLLNALDPQLIIIGNAPYEYIDYGDSRMTITQNTAGDIIFVNDDGYVHIYSQHKIDNIPSCLKCLSSKYLSPDVMTPFYCGSLKIR